MNLTTTRAKMTALSAIAALFITTVFIFNPIYLFLIVAAGWILSLAWIYPKQTSILLCLGFILHPFLVVRVVPHYFNVPENILALWKEAVLFALILRSITMRSKHKNSIHDWAMLLFAGIGTIYIFMSPSLSVGFQGFRLYFECVAVYYIIRRFQYEKEDIQRFLKWLFRLTFFVGIWALFSTLIIGPKLLFWLGYQDKLGQLPSSFLIQGHVFLRAFGTASAPNNYGLIVVITILLLFQYKDLFRGRFTHGLFLLVQFSALIATFSRSSWLGLLACVIYLFIKGNMQNKSKLILSAVASLFILISTMIAFPNNYVTKFVQKTINMQDSSAAGHASSYSEAFEFMSLHPLGTGLGTAGPQSFLLTGKMVNVESSFFLAAFEMGILGMVILILLNGSLIVSCLQKADKLSQGVGLAWLACFVSFLVLPTIQSMEVMFLLFFLTGMLFSNSKLREQEEAIPHG